MEENLKTQIKETLIKSLGESLSFIRKSTIETFKISDKNKIKGDNPVTQIDLDSQELIINNIKNNFPHHAILGEEGNHEKSFESEFLWIIDPIDGTKNFINQIPIYCVSIAIMYKEEILAGGVAIPWDGSSIIYAIKGEGITSSFPKNQHLDKSNKPVPGILSFAPTYFNLSNIINKEFYKNSGELRNLGSAAAEIALVANGNAQLAISGNAYTWDFAAAWILIKESKKSIYYGNMKKNKWEDINPWEKFYKDGVYDLENLKKWRGKFFASDREIYRFILNNVKPNGRSKNDIIRRFKKFIFLA